MFVLLCLLLVLVEIDAKRIALVEFLDLSVADLDGESGDDQGLLDFLPGSAIEFRTAGPVPHLSELGMLSGQFPGKLTSATEMVDHSLHQVFAESGYNVAHFGRWGFDEEILGTAGISHHFQSDHFQEIVQEAISFEKEHREDSDLLMVLFMPRIDVTFDHGVLQPQSESSWSMGVEGPKDKFWTTCPEVSRQARYTPRYKTCPRQVYKANRRHEFSIISNFLALRSRFDLMILTSSNGEEVETVDAHSLPRTTFRGHKYSLYEGGLRVPFRFTMNRMITHSMHGIDVFPTLLGFANVNKPSFLQGMDFSPCLESSSKCDSLLQRKTPMVWAYLGPTPTIHCRNRSPLFAMIKGEFKLLMDDERVEFFHLKRGDFELANLAESKLEDNMSQANLDLVFTDLKASLRRWIQDNGFFGTRSGCLGSLASVTDSRITPSSKPTSNMSLKNRLRGIVLILTDDMGFGDISHNLKDLSDEILKVDTPLFDKLLSEGLVMNQFHANGAICSPTRAAAMTGRLPSHKQVAFHGITSESKRRMRNVGTASYLGEGRNIDKFTTMTRFFKDHNFVTGAFGKWHLGFVSEGEYNPDGRFYGLDEFQLFSMNMDFAKEAFDFPTASKPHDNFLDNTDLEFPSYAQQKIVNRTLDFIKDRVHHDEKFFAYVCTHNPHAPLNLATDFDQPAANGFESSVFNAWPYQKEGMQLPREFASPNLPIQIYQTLLRDQERSVARLVEEIDAIGIGAETIIIHSSDNGPEDRGFIFEMAGSPGAFRGAKRSLYDGGIRVPFYIRWKGTIEPEGLLTRPAFTADIFPTLAGLAGLREEFEGLVDFHEMQGEDLSCVILGSCGFPRSFVDDARPLLFESRLGFQGDCLGHSPRFAVRKGKYKYLWEPASDKDWFPDSNSRTDREELFDLMKDPMEHTNLALTRSGDRFIKKMLKEMREHILDYVSSDAYDKKYTMNDHLVAIHGRQDETSGSFYLREKCASSKNRRTPKNIEIGFNEVRQLGLLPHSPCSFTTKRRKCRKSKTDGLCKWRKTAKKCILRRKFSNLFLQ